MKSNLSSPRQRRAAQAFQEGKRMNLIPLIDIFTTILIFLLATAFVAQAQMQLAQTESLPYADAKPLDLSPNRIEVSEGLVAINGKDFSWREWPAGLGAEILPDRPVLLIADRTLSYSRMNRVLSELEKKGLHQIQFLTQARNGVDK